ncbi:phage portal protein [Nonomuraea sp. K274]|uniref:Phage portal protein n=1 Tax=Nonomuraea cypriaca TaxID=1187855 RepID=A0A931A7A8_9ACTN|nr:phage portal protein [Nonomuraea cypriaca]MBF8186330.1 phage portal protein [Nonomuraea cypriaca]
MPLPDGGAWPPTAQGPILDKITEWSAWYSGDADQLSVFYGGERADGFDDTSRRRLVNRPSQYRGGVVGRVARWWWGEPVAHGDRRSKLHLPLAGDIASTSADLLFSEPPTLTVEHAATQERLDALADNGLRADLLEAAEVCAALGGVYLRTCWDREIRPEGPWLSAVHPDAAVPEWRWGVLTAVTFWRVIAADGKTVIRHLERHEPGAIHHALYEGTQEDLGRSIPLTEHHETAPIADELTDGDVIETGVPSLTAGYIPNMRPNRVWRAIPAAAPLGRSDFAGAEPLMDALDEVYSSLMRDVRIGKGRLVVPSAYLENLGAGQGATFIDREAYEAVDALAGADRMELQAHQFAIRVNDHLTAAEHLMTQIVRTAGYSAQSFGQTGDVAATATEVKARERRSMITRDKKTGYWQPGVAARIENLLAIDREMFGTPVEPSRPRVQFGDSVSEDMLSLANTADVLRRAEAASTEVIVALLHPDWDETQVTEEVKRIKAERGSPVGDPLAIRPVSDALASGDIFADEGQDDEQPDEDTAA